MFWSSVILTGNQTQNGIHYATKRFWSSVILTGNQTSRRIHANRRKFWSSVILTGNQTVCLSIPRQAGFWSSVILTGNQTAEKERQKRLLFWSSVILTGNQSCSVLLFFRYLHVLQKTNNTRHKKTNLPKFPTGSLFNKPCSAVHILAASARSALVVAHAV